MIKIGFYKSETLREGKKGGKRGRFVKNFFRSPYDDCHQQLTCGSDGSLGSRWSIYALGEAALRRGTIAEAIAALAGRDAKSSVAGRVGR